MHQACVLFHGDRKTIVDPSSDLDILSELLYTPPVGIDPIPAGISAAHKTLLESFLSVLVTQDRQVVREDNVLRLPPFTDTSVLDGLHRACLECDESIPNSLRSAVMDAWTLFTFVVGKDEQTYAGVLAKFFLVYGIGDGFRTSIEPMDYGAPNTTGSFGRMIMLVALLTWSAKRVMYNVGRYALGPLLVAHRCVQFQYMAVAMLATQLPWVARFNDNEYGICAVRRLMDPARGSQYADRIHPTGARRGGGKPGPIVRNTPVQRLWNMAMMVTETMCDSVLSGTRASWERYKTTHPHAKESDVQQMLPYMCAKIMRRRDDGIVDYSVSTKKDYAKLKPDITRILGTEDRADDVLNNIMLLACSRPYNNYYDRTEEKPPQSDLERNNVNLTTMFTGLEKNMYNTYYSRPKHKRAGMTWDLFCQIQGSNQRVGFATSKDREITEFRNGFKPVRGGSLLLGGIGDRKARTVLSTCFVVDANRLVVVGKEDPTYAHPLGRLGFNAWAESVEIRHAIEEHDIPNQPWLDSKELFNRRMAAMLDPTTQVRMRRNCVFSLLGPSYTRMDPVESSPVLPGIARSEEDCFQYTSETFDPLFVRMVYAPTFTSILRLACATTHHRGGRMDPAAVLLADDERTKHITRLILDPDRAFMSMKFPITGGDNKLYDNFACVRVPDPTELEVDVFATRICGRTSILPSSTFLVGDIPLSLRVKTRGMAEDETVSLATLFIIRGATPDCIHEINMMDAGNVNRAQMRKVVSMCRRIKEVDADYVVGHMFAENFHFRAEVLFLTARNIKIRWDEEFREGFAPISNAYERIGLLVLNEFGGDLTRALYCTAHVEDGNNLVFDN
jgi:hypothetical protein